VAGAVVSRAEAYEIIVSAEEGVNETVARGSKSATLKRRKKPRYFMLPFCFVSKQSAVACLNTVERRWRKEAVIIHIAA